MTVLYLRAISSVAFLALAAAGAGRWIEPLLPKNFTKLDRAALVLVGGLGVLGTSLFVIGQWNFSRPVIVAVLAVAGAFGIVPAAKFARRALSFWKCYPPPKLAALAIILVLVITTFAGLAEITGTWENDAIFYHLLGPKVWLRDALIRPVLDNCLTSFPPIAEIFFASLLPVGDNRAPGFSSILTFSLLLLIVAAIAWRSGLGCQGAWWCVALVATMPAVYAGAHSCFIDVVYASFVLAAVRVALDAEKKRHFVVLGFFCGFAMGTKYIGILMVPAIFLVASIMRTKSLKAINLPLLKNMSTGVAIACLVACPFYLRNWILLGSPIYPAPLIFFHFFHPKYMFPETVRQMQIFLWYRGQGLGRSPLAYLLLPYNLTYHTSRFHGAGGIGLAPLAFCPFALLLARRSRVAKALSVLAFIFTTVWFAQQESRYLIPAYPIVAVLAVLGWRWLLAGARKPVAALAAAVVGLSILYGCFMISSARRDDLHAVFSASYAERFRREHIPFFESFEYLNYTPSVRKVLILDASVTPYYLDRDYLKPLGSWGEHLLPYANNTGDVLPHLQELGISHILDVSSTVAPFQVPQDYPGLQLILDLPNQRIYRVVPMPKVPNSVQTNGDLSSVGSRIRRNHFLRLKPPTSRFRSQGV